MASQHEARNRRFLITKGYKPVIFDTDNPRNEEDWVGVAKCDHGANLVASRATARLPIVHPFGDKWKATNRGDHYAIN